MKRFYALLGLEFAGLFPPLCALVGVMAALEAVLYGLALWNVEKNVPFTYLIDSSGIAFVFVLAMAVLLTLVALRFAQNYAPSKSIYALLTLPVRRERVYFAKLIASLLAGFCVVAAQLALLLLALTAYARIPVIGVYPPQHRSDGKNAILYLALLDSRFLRLLVPPDAFSLAFSLSILCGAVCLTLSVSARVRAGLTVRVVVMAAVWLSLVSFTFPLTDYKLWHSVVKLVLFIIIPFAASVAGARVFRSGEATA